MSTFKYDGQEFKITSVNAKERQEAKTIYRRVFFKALEDGAFLQANALEKATEWGLWSEEKDKELLEIQTELNALLGKLEEGGYDFEEAVEDAMKAGELRNKLFNINLTISDLMAHSAEKQAEDAESDYLLWAGLKKGKNKVYKTYDDFVIAKQDNDPLIYVAISNQIGFSNKYYKDLPENKFLLEFGRMSEDLVYLDKDGNPLSEKEEPKKKERKPFVGAPVKKTEEPEAVEDKPEKEPEAIPAEA